MMSKTQHAPWMYRALPLLEEAVKYPYRVCRKTVVVGHGLTGM
jgi:hypothetical protein